MLRVARVQLLEYGDVWESTRSSTIYGRARALIGKPRTLPQGLHSDIVSCFAQTSNIDSGLAAVGDGVWKAAAGLVDEVSKDPQLDVSGQV